MQDWVFTVNTVSHKLVKSYLLAYLCKLLIIKNQRVGTCILSFATHSFPSSLNNTYLFSYFFLFSDLISLNPPVSPSLPELHLLQGRLLFLLIHYHHYNYTILFSEQIFFTVYPAYSYFVVLVCMKRSSEVGSEFFLFLVPSLLCRNSTNPTN